MKICPRCQKTYSDESLNFCLDDGATLLKSNQPDDSLPATVSFNQPHSNVSNQSFSGQSVDQTGWNQSSNPNPSQFTMHPPKKSKNWLLALGVLGVLTLLCGGGFIGFIFWAASLEDSNNNSNATSGVNDSKRNSPPSRTNIQKIDLSLWARSDNSMGVTNYTDGEFVMESKQKSYYYVLTSPAEYKTENATTKVTVKNISEANTRLGFGLIIHSDPKPLKQDYAFLIDSENKKYRVVRHAPDEETAVEDWTHSSAIKDGMQKNVLEVSDENKKMNFYINGVFVTAVENTDGYRGGVTGLYSGDAVQIAFSEFAIFK